MKVQHVNAMDVVREVVGRGIVDGQDVYIFAGFTWAPVHLYRPVETWKDVTGECEVEENLNARRRIVHKLKDGNIADVMKPCYRLQRMLVHIGGLPRYAFTIEKQGDQ